MGVVGGMAVDLTLPHKGIAPASSKECRGKDGVHRARKDGVCKDLPALGERGG